jgi:hypothetical protein
MPLDDPLWVFVRPLNREGLRYMVTGATAAIIYGVPRRKPTSRVAHVFSSTL